MQEIELQALKTYQENLEYLKESHKALYKEISLFNTIIEDGIYTEQYALEYKDEGYFDIKELLTGEYLYKQNSIQQAKAMARMIDMKRAGAVFKGQKYAYASEKHEEEIDKSELSFHNALWATIKLINYVSKYAAPDTFMNRVNKIIFLGTGLGLHLQCIIEKLNARIVFIKEKNLEIFRLSLFVTNYKKLAESKSFHFSVTDDEVEERTNFLAFLDEGNNYNLNIKHIPFTLNYSSELQRLQTHVLSQSYINYGYSAMLLRFIDSPLYLSQGYSFINVTQRYNTHKKNIFAKKPVLLLYSGPSSSKNIEWIQANRDRFIVVSALSTCKLLHRIGITPDVVVHIDPGKKSALLFEGFDPKEYFKNTTILLASNVDEATVQKFDRSHIHFIEQGTLYKKGFGKLSAPSVGEYSYGLFLLLGAANLFMLGIDLALDSETFLTHGDFHFGQTQGKLDSGSASLNPRTSMEFIKGNLLEQVPTLSPYKLSVSQVEIFTQVFKQEYHHVYNLSNGAFLEGCEPLRFKDYDWGQLEPLNRDEIQQQINDFFQEIGSDDFNEGDKGQIRYQVKEAKKLQKHIKAFQKKKFANAEAYLNTLAKLSWDLSDMDLSTGSDLAQVYYEYFSIVLSYIFDLFNTKNLANPHKHVTQINAILVKQLLKISNLYITKLESYLK